jgi:putative spermidine/putrescine transport system ATP-binding protein
MNQLTSVAKSGESGPSAVAPALKFVSVAKRYGQLEAVKELSFDINAGQFVALLGPSGCGKTTLLNLVAGFVSPDEGDIVINGRSVRHVPSHDRGVGVVFQDYALFPHMTVAENLAFPLEVRGMSKRDLQAKVKNALDLVHLTDLGERRPDQLSGGQQQRVALARALIYEPPILLLDEPFGALDRRLRDSMQFELKSLHRRLGITFVFVTHDQDEAMAMADMVVVMKGGRIQQYGSPQQLYDRPRTQFVAGFLGDCNVLSGTVTREGIQGKDGRTLLHISPRALDTANGQERAIALRPEWITILGPQDEPPPQSQVLEGRVAQARFLGREVMLDVNTALGNILVRFSRAGSETAPPPAGSLRLAWDPRRTVPLEE